MAESIHQKLSRVRKPHVHITMDIDGDGLPVRELPFVVGVMSDLTGDSMEAYKPLEDRQFIEIDRDNFNAVMARMKPGLSFKVENTLTDEAGTTEFQVDLKFESMEDFEPGRIVAQVPVLKKLLDARNKLDELAGAVDRSKGGEALLEQILQNADQIGKLGEEIGEGSQASKSGDKS
jgi:type VI secretion system protein ImpB